jgi:hypothetical protein
LSNGHWQYPEDIDINKWFGFIYRIVEIDTGREYIGKKQFHSYTKKKIKDRKNKKTVVKESTWRKYTGSSNELNQCISDNGMDNYAFFIESLHESRGSLYYAEVHKHVTENVLREKFDNGDKKYFNKNISGVKFIPPEPTLPESYTDISSFHLAEDHTPNENSSNTQGGLTWEEYYGTSRSGEFAARLLECAKPESPSSRGLHSEEQKEKWRKDERRRHAGKDNGMYGKPAYYKMTEDEKQKWKDNVGKAGKGKKKPLVTCPHCGKEGGKPSMTRFHFDNCKTKKPVDTD